MNCVVTSECIRRSRTDFIYICFIFFLFTTHHDVYEYVETTCERKLTSLEIRNESFDETTECIFKCEKIKTLKMLIALASSHRALRKRLKWLKKCLNGIMGHEEPCWDAHVRKAFLNWNGYHWILNENDGSQTGRMVDVVDDRNGRSYKIPYGRHILEKLWTKIMYLRPSRCTLCPGWWW